MSKTNFKNIDFIHEMLIKRIKKYNKNLKKLFKSATVNFTWLNELGTDASGLTNEVID